MKNKRSLCRDFIAPIYAGAASEAFGFSWTMTSVGILTILMVSCLKIHQNHEFDSEDLYLGYFIFRD